MKLTELIAASAALFGAALSSNNDPIVLVHGLGGNENSFEYRAELEQAGLKTHAVAVNGYAGNWDRAAELFAILKGTRVDYGACHSSDEGHLRFGEDYSGRGILPDWDSNHKIHLMGHSMGGLTIRWLEKLLEEGSGCAEDTSELYSGGNDWITSITTMASPMDGTTIFDDFFLSTDFLIKQFINLGTFEEGELDFPQWGLEQQPGESFDDYIDRVEDSGLFDEEDFSAYELSVTGATAFNAIARQTFPGRYYFSYATERTNPEEDCTLFFFSCEIIQVPDDKMSSDLRLPSKIIGKGDSEVDRENDGIVNRDNARCPTGKNCKHVADGSTEWTPGQWHTVLLDFLDHYQITDRDTANDNSNFMNSAKRIYLEHGVRLKNLPSKSVRTLTTDEEFAADEKAARVARYLEAKRFFAQELEQESSNAGRTVAVVVSVFCIMALVALLGKITLKNKKTTESSDSNKGSMVSATL